MRKLTFICALAIVFAVSTVAFAEVQSIRVSGEINTYGIYRGAGSSEVIYWDTTRSDNESFIESTIGLNFDADLTENVAAHLRLVSQRDWDNSSTASTTQWDVGLAQAYITLSEMLYEPLTIRIGTQPLYFGRGLIIGSTMNDDFFNVDPESSIAADEYSLYDNSFDSINATLDYAPWTIDLGYVKIGENAISVDDDHTVLYTNVGYDFENEYTAEVEGYLLCDATGEAATTYAKNEIYTIGVRGSMAPVANSSIFAEVAHQFGDITQTPISSTNYYVTDRSKEVDVDAMAYEVGGEYAWVDVLTSPKIGLKYTSLEGDKLGDSTGDYQGFTAPYMRKSDTAIIGWYGRLYDAVGTASGTANDSPAYTNMEQILVTGNLKPLAAMDNEDVNLEIKYAHLEFNESPQANCDSEIGDELDLNLTYDYTEDVQFGLLSAIFFPGKFFDNSGTEASADYNDDIYEIVGSCKVTF